MTDTELDRALEVARDVAHRAGELLLEGHREGQVIAVDHKGEVDLVTEYDRRSEALVVQTLTRAFPHHTVVGEEGGHSNLQHPDRPVWFVDPLDGTTNYAHGLPWFAVSIGLELEGEPLLGVVHAPQMGWDHWAIRGRGTFLGQTRLTVSSAPTLDDALVATGFPYDRRTSEHNNVAQLAAMLRRCQGIRRIGVASLDCAMVAQGCLDAYWEFKLKPWDICAGALLVLEAGGRVTLADGAPYSSAQGSIAASNGRVHDELLRVLADSAR